MSESLAQCNYRTIVDPTSADNASRGYYVGAHWTNENTNTLYKCTASDHSSATWTSLESGTVDLSGLLPLAGGTMTGNLDMGNNSISGLAQIYSGYSGVDMHAGWVMHGNSITMNDGNGAGGGALNMEGGILNMGDGSGYAGSIDSVSGGTGGDLNMDGGKITHYHGAHYEDNASAISDGGLSVGTIYSDSSGNLKVVI